MQQHVLRLTARDASLSASQLLLLLLQEDCRSPGCLFTRKGVAGGAWLQNELQANTHAARCRARGREEGGLEC